MASVPAATRTFYPLRLFVCQKNETRLLKPWLEHALSIVDVPRDICVVDDNSTDTGVLETLDWAEQTGVTVLRVRPPELPAFLRKNILFTRWVQSHSSMEPAFYVPLDCDEFLAARGRLKTTTRPEQVRLAHAVLPINTSLNHRKRAIRSALQVLSSRGFGTSTIRRLRNFSHVPGLFSDIREHKWCGVNRKIIVFGGGKVTLRHALAIPDRGYHDVVTGRNHGPTATLCLVEFHNMPFGERQRKSLVMSTLVPPGSQRKYVTEGQTTRAEYEFGQEAAAHMQPTARALEFSALVPDMVYDFEDGLAFRDTLMQLRATLRAEAEDDAMAPTESSNAERGEGDASESLQTIPSGVPDNDSGGADCDSAVDEGTPSGAKESLVSETPSRLGQPSQSTDHEILVEYDDAADVIEDTTQDLPFGWLALSEEERAEVQAETLRGDEESGFEMTPSDAKGSDACEDGSRVDACEDGSRVDACEDGSRVDACEDGSEVDAHEDGSGVDAHEDGSGVDAHEDGSRVDTHEDGSRVDACEDGSGVELREDGSGVELREDGSGVELREDGSGIDARADGSGGDR